MTFGIRMDGFAARFQEQQPISGSLRVHHTSQPAPATHGLLIFFTPVAFFYYLD
jgi:hypothetical protein